MSSTTLLLVLLALFGHAYSHLSSEDVGSSSDGSRAIADAFLADMQTAIQSGDKTRIADFFADDFVGLKCFGPRTKEQYVHKLSSRHETIRMPVFRTTRFIGDDQIEVTTRKEGGKGVLKKIGGRFVVSRIIDTRCH